jgi:hypothetical protein
MATDQSTPQHVLSTFVEANRIQVSIVHPPSTPAPGDGQHHQHDHSTSNAQDYGGQHSANKGGKFGGEKGTKRARSVTGTFSHNSHIHAWPWLLCTESSLRCWVRINIQNETATYMLNTSDVWLDGYWCYVNCLPWIHTCYMHTKLHIY